MTKKELWRYQDKLEEVSRLEKRIRKRERDAEGVPTIKGTVQSSQKQWPYLPTRETVDAPEPRQYSAIMRDIALLRQKKAEADEELLRLDKFIYSIEDERARRVLTMRYIERRKLKDVAMELDMTEQGVLKIINKNIHGV